MNAFEHAVQLTKFDDTTFSGELGAGWGNGASAFGGLLIALMANAMQQCEPDPARRVRTLSADLLAAAKPGPITVRVQTLRRGKLQSNLHAKLEQAGETIATASAMTSGPRPGEGPLFAPAPPAPMATESAPVFPLAPPMGPVFAQNYVYRTPGPYPFSGGPEALADGLLSERDPRDIWTIPAIIGLLDAYWPAHYAELQLPRLMVTVGFTAQFLMDPAALSPEAVFRYRAKAIAGRDGFVVELRELWSDGMLVALNQQTFAFVR